MYVLKRKANSLLMVHARRMPRLRMSNAEVYLSLPAEVQRLHLSAGCRSLWEQRKNHLQPFA